jgi:zinc protease
MSAGLNPTRVVLPNGVVITAKQTRKTPAVAISLAIRAGAIVDPGDAAGASFLLSRVLDRGTTSRSGSEIVDALENRGVSLSLSVTRQLFSLTCTCLSEDFEDIFALLADIVRHPVVPEDDLVTRKGQVLTSLRQDADNPAVRSVDALMAALYGGTHPYGRPIKGTAESVAPLTREQLLTLHADRFAPHLLSAVVVGDVEPARVEACATAMLGDWRHDSAAPVVLTEPVRPATRRLVTVPMMNKAQADIAYGFPSIARSDRSYFAFMLMNNILGQYALGGRLGDRIRERQGMAYYVSSSFDASTIAGPFMVRAGVAAGNVERAIASIDDELQLLRRAGVTGREMAESRQYISGSMPRMLETNAGIAGFLQNAEFFGLGLDYDRRLPTLLMMVTIDEVNAAAAALDPAHATVVVAGPYQP